MLWDGKGVGVVLACYLKKRLNRRFEFKEQNETLCPKKAGCPCM